MYTFNGWTEKNGLVRLPSPKRWTHGDSSWETKRMRFVLIAKASRFIVPMNHYPWLCSCFLHTYWTWCGVPLHLPASSTKTKRGRFVSQPLTFTPLVQRLTYLTIVKNRKFSMQHQPYKKNKHYICTRGRKVFTLLKHQWASSPFFTSRIFWSIDSVLVRAY